MKIVIADGFHEADYIISLFNTKFNDLVVINEDEDVCRYLSESNDIPVMHGRCTRANELKEAGAENCAGRRRVYRSEGGNRPEASYSARRP